MDTSALMALVLAEPGAERVRAEVGEGVVCAAVLAECLSKLAAKGADPEAVRRQFTTAGLQVEPFGEDDIAPVVALYPFAKQGVSLADRFCLAFALRRGLPVLTGDRPWAGLGLPLQVELIR